MSHLPAPMTTNSQIKKAEDLLKRLKRKKEHEEAHQQIKAEVFQEQQHLHSLCMQCLDEEETEQLIEADLAAMGHPGLFWDRMAA